MSEHAKFVGNVKVHEMVLSPNRSVEHDVFASPQWYPFPLRDLSSVTLVAYGFLILEHLSLLNEFHFLLM